MIPLNVALSSTEGTITISGQEIPCTTIDALVQKLLLLCVNVMKIDVEGAGAEIIKGTIQTIIKWKPVIFFEVHNKAEKLAVKELENLDYTAIKRFGNMFILIPPKSS